MHFICRTLEPNPLRGRRALSRTHEIGSRGDQQRRTVSRSRAPSVDSVFATVMDDMTRKGKIGKAETGHNGPCTTTARARGGSSCLEYGGGATYDGIGPLR